MWRTRRKRAVAEPVYPAAVPLAWHTTRIRKLEWYYPMGWRAICAVYTTQMS